MNWINAFEILCYVITAILLWDIIRKKSWKELRLFLSAFTIWGQIRQCISIPDGIHMQLLKWRRKPCEGLSIAMTTSMSTHG